MENLMLRMQRDILTWSILLILIIGILIFEAWELRKHQQKLERSKKQRKKALHAAVKKGRTSVIVCACLVAVCLLTGAVAVGEYVLDRREEPLVIEGLVTSTHYYKSGRNQRKQYRVIIDDGSSGKGLGLYIHNSLIEVYGIEEGEWYRMTYYPRTNTLCEAEKIK